MRGVRLGLVFPAAIVLSATLVGPSARMASPEVEVARAGSGAAVSGAILYVGGPGSLGSEGRYVKSGLYAVDAGGGRLKELVRGEVAFARWSPDGRLLAFTRPDGGNAPRLYVVSASGGAPRLLVRTSVFAWAPDSRRIAYLDPSGGTFAIGVDGRGRLQLSEQGGPGLTWSPDGTKLAFVGADQGLVVARIGHGTRRLTPGIQMSVALLSWSPDSRRIAFYPCCQTGFAIVDATGAHLRRLVGRGVLLPSWSPDGRWIGLGGEITTGSTSVAGTFLIRPDGSLFRRVSTLGGNPFPPVWSPDSRTLAVQDRCCSPDLWTVPVNGRRPQRLTHGWRFGYGIDAPQWQPAVRSTGALGGRYVSPANPTDTVVRGGVLRTTRPIQALFADGSQVAYTTDRSCELTTVPSRSVTRVGYCVGATGGETWPRTYGVGFAGGRLLWASMSPAMGGDNWNLSTSSITTPRADRVSSFYERNTPVAGVAGDGSLLVFSTWGPCRIGYGDPCATGPKRNGVLWKLEGMRAAQIASGDGAMTPLAVDAGRVLVDHEDGTLEVLREDGTSISTVRLEPGDSPGPTQAKLQGNDLVVLTTGPFVKRYDATTGRLTAQWPLSATKPRLHDVQDGIAAYVNGFSAIQLIRLSDGRNVTLLSAGDPQVQLEPSGLTYSSLVDDPVYPGRVAFIPLEDLPLR